MPWLLHWLLHSVEVALWWKCNARISLSIWLLQIKLVQNLSFLLKKKIKPNQFYFILSSITWGVVPQSIEPEVHILNVRAFRIELEFRSVGFWGGGETGEPGEKPLGAEKRTNNKLNPYMTPGPGIEPRVTLVGGECSHHSAIPSHENLF